MTDESRKAEQRIILSGALPNVSYFVVWDAVDWLTANGYAIVPVPVPAPEPGPDVMP